MTAPQTKAAAAEADKAGPDKELINLAFRIKPVMTVQGGRLYFLEPVDLYDKLWGEPMDVACRAEGHVSELARVPVKLPVSLWRGLVDAPTMAQVLPQIPKEYRDSAVAFEVRSNGGDRDGDNGCLLATATLYSGGLPPEIAGQPVIAWRRTYTVPFPEAPPAPAFDKAAATALGSDVPVSKPVQFRKPPGISGPG